MDFKDRGGLEKGMYINKEGERVIRSQRPDDIDWRVRIQEERDFIMAQALKEGRGSEIYDISRLPDEHFKKIIEERERKK